ncbi:MAG: outer membrane protein assembly factor BamD, partial [Deltaproteobacteria bacterium]|nr:outer membrane protein assembly factor BamD [Deltaproteobacteria bacterium]
MLLQSCRKSSTRLRFSTVRLLVMVLILALAAACASHKMVTDNPQTLFQEAEKAYQEESYTRANELFQAVQNEFPDSDYAKLALLRNGDIAYCRKELEDAARTYNDFINFNADHPKAPYAYYQVGMTHYVTLKTIDLDLEALRKALEVFQEGLAHYPDSPPYTAKLIQRINDCKRRFAKREFYIGFYYYKQGKFHSAIKRFEYLLKTYPGFIDDKVLYYLGLANLNRGNVDAGHQALLTLTKAFPASPFTVQARPWLEKDEGPGLPLLFMARDYFLVKDFDISDRYLTTTFMPDKYAPRLFNMLSGQKTGGEKAQAVTFASLYRPVTPTASAKTGSRVAVAAPRLENGSPQASPSAGLETAPGAKLSPAGPGAPGAQDLRSPALLGKTDDPLEIISDWTEADRQKGIIKFGGKVIAKQKDVVLYADQVVNYFDMQSQKLLKAIAVGNVKLNQADKFVTCERAELIQAERKVILTGNPVMWQGENRVTGERIVIYLDQSQAEVFGGEKGKAKVKIL